MNICKVVVFLILLFGQYKLYAQKDVSAKISPDSILSLFKTKSAIEVMYMDFEFNKLDFKAYHKDLRLKPYFMTWLNPDSIMEYRIKEDLSNLIIRNKDYWDSDIRGFIKKKKRDITLDSILKNPKLYNLYKDSVISAYQNGIRKNYKKRGFKIIPGKVFVFHSFLHYPESYTIIKNFWIKEGKKTKGYLFWALLVMEDPEAEELYTKRIDNYINNKDYEFIRDFLIENTYFLNSFSYKQWFKLLAINKKIDPFGHGNKENMRYFYCDDLRALVHDLYQFGEDIPPNKSCDYYAAMKEEIIKKSERYLKYLDEQNQYWKKNMKYFRSDK
jgi:hypothetical protein